MPPWEKYKKAEEAPSGPWAKYAIKPPVVAPENPGILKRADQAAGNVIQAGLDVIAAPFELVGESLRIAQEGKPLSDFRAPTIVQRGRDNALTAANPPADPFSQINKGVRAVAGAVQKLPQGLDAAIQGGRDAYNADRGAMGTVEDVALSLTTGKINPKVANAPIDALMEGARKAVKAGKSILSIAKKAGTNAGKRVMSATLGPSIEDINLRIARNPEVVNAKPFDVLARELPDDVQKFADEVGKLSGSALDKLSSSKYLIDGATAKESLLGAVRSEKASLGRSVSDATSQAKKVLDRYAFRLRRLGNTVSEQELGKIIRDIDNDIDWSAKEMAPLNNALEGVRTKIDSILKGQNPAYAEAMIPVAEGTRNLKKIQQIFGVENDVGKGFKSKDVTATKLKGAIKEGRLDSQEALKALEGLTGRNYLREAENAAVAEAFVGGKTNGSRRVNLGAALGAAAGAPFGGWTGASIGSLAGAMGGAYIDTQGARIAGGIIDDLVRRSMTPSKARNIPQLSDPMRRVLAAAGVFNADGPTSSSKVQEILSPRLIDSDSEARVLALSPDMMASRNAIIALDGGDFVTAREEWRRALELNPKNMEARRGLERLAQKDGKDLDAYKPKARGGR